MHPWIFALILCACGRLSFDIERSDVYIEAELGVVTPNMQIVDDPSASGGAYVLDDNPQGLPGPGRIATTFAVPATASYKIWGRVLAPDSSSDSFWVSLDSETESTFCLAFDGFSSQWQWAPINSTETPVCADAEAWVVVLSAGAHSLAFTSREGLSAIDEILITDDLTTVPSD